MNAALTIVLTYLLHSTLWFGFAYLLQSIRGLASQLKVHVWQCAGLAGLFSTLVAVLGWTGPINTTLGFDPLTIDPSLADNQTTTSLFESNWLANWSALSPWLVVVWALGALFQLARFGRNIAQLIQRVANRRPLKDPVILDMVQATAQQMGLRRRIRLSTSDAITSPIALTWREICFPNQLLDEIDTPTLLAILGHELCHLRRFDPITLPLFSLIAAIAWPQSLWRLFFHYRDLEVERVCDRAGSRVVNSPRLMAESLIHVAQWIGTAPNERTVAALHGHRSSMYDRVSQLLSSTTAPMGRKQKVSMYLIPSAMLIVAAFIPQFEAKSTPPLTNPTNESAIQNLSHEKTERIRRPETSVEGAIDRAKIREVVRANIDQVRHCYNQALEIDSTLEGSLSVAFTIGATGTVSSSRLSWSTLNNPALESCIVDIMATWHYPKPEDGGKVAVTYPFILSPG